MKLNSFCLGAVQFACDEGPDGNLKKAAHWIASAAKDGAQVIVLPELFRTPYFCQTEDPAFFDLAEPVPGPTTTALGQVAREHGVVVLAPIFERRAPGLYHNSLVVLSETGEVAGLYRKMHIPDDPGFYEKFYFTPGDLGFKTFHTTFGPVGTLICWDQWYPEAARLTALQGAAVLCYPTAIGWSPDEKATQGQAQHSAWQTVQRGHAIANGVYVAAVNRVGVEQAGESSLEFWGQSFICDPQGVVLAEAGVNTEEVLMAQIDISHLEALRRMWPFWRDRRIDAYQGLDKRWSQ